MAKSQALETRIVFLDTQIFVEQKFNFKSPGLHRLGKLGNLKEIDILISDVVDKEVRSKIDETLHKIEISKNKLLKEINFLNQKKLKAEIEKALPNGTLLKMGVKQWDDYQKKSKIKILSSQEISIQKLLDFYFKGLPPFKGKKNKNEFLDAISLLSLLHWSEGRVDKIYIISRDKGIEIFCKENRKYIHIPQLSNFLDIYNKNQEKLTNILSQSINNEIGYIKKNIEIAFVNCEFNYIDDLELEVVDVQVEKIEIENIDIIDIPAKSKNKYVCINIITYITYFAHLSGPDYSSSVWDSEDKTHIFLNQIDEKKKFGDMFNISMEILFKGEKAQEIKKIRNIEFNGGHEIKLQDDYKY